MEKSKLEKIVIDGYYNDQKYKIIKKTRIVYLFYKNGTVSQVTCDKGEKDYEELINKLLKDSKPEEPEKLTTIDDWNKLNIYTTSQLEDKTYENNKTIKEMKQEIESLKDENYDVKNKNKGIKNVKFFKKMALIGTLLISGLGLKACADTPKGTVVASDNNQDKDKLSNNEYGSVLAKTNLPVQKEVMTDIYNEISYLNNDFADAFVKEKDDKRFTLTYDEAAALKLGLNEYSKNDIADIFNGDELNSHDFVNYYKNASLQLLGGYVLEDEDNRVNLHKFMNNEEDKTFVKKYEDLLFKIKNSKGEEKESLVKEFAEMIKEDYPITEDVREEGLSHADGRKLQDEKHTAAANVISAFLAMARNDGFDSYLSEKELNYLNDFATMCFIEDKFTRYESYSINREFDNINPTYTDYKTAYETEYALKYGIILVDIKDDDRDLMDNSKVQEKFGIIENETYVEEQEVVEETHTEVTKTETNNRQEAIEKTDKNKVEEAEKEVEQEIKKGNEESKQEAEEKLDKIEQQEQNKTEQQEQQKEDIENKVQEELDEINKGQQEQKPVPVPGPDANIHLDDRVDENGDGIIDDSYENFEKGDHNGEAVPGDTPLPDGPLDDEIDEYSYDGYSLEDEYQVEETNKPKVLVR